MQLRELSRPPKVQANLGLYSMEMSACREKSGGRRVPHTAFPLPRLVIVSVVCSQVQVFCGAQSVLEVL